MGGRAENLIYITHIYSQFSLQPFKTNYLPYDLNLQLFLGVPLREQKIKRTTSSGWDLFACIENTFALKTGFCYFELMLRYFILLQAT